MRRCRAAALPCRRQDEDLEDLSEAVKKLGVVAGTIGEELDSQGKLLDDLEEDVDGVGNRLGAAQRKLKTVIEKTGMKGQLAIIACLVITLVILMGASGLGRLRTRQSWLRHPQIPTPTRPAVLAVT